MNAFTTVIAVVAAFSAIVVILATGASKATPASSDLPGSRIRTRVEEQPARSYSSSDNPVVYALAAGARSEWIFIMGKKLTVYPGYQNVSFELKLEDGTIIPGPKNGNWSKEKAVYARMTTTEDIRYTIAEWRLEDVNK